MTSAAGGNKGPGITPTQGLYCRQKRAPGKGVSVRGGSVARVLVIDDERVIREVIADALELTGHEVLAVADGRAGVDAAREGSYELVITDIVLPDCNGFDTIAALQGEDPSLKFLVISGGSKKLREEYCQSSGAGSSHRVLEKPFKIEELIRVVGELVE
ncbi:MAG: response regulator [Chitinivibrionales bacterium]|nr:response regulator [Chitinivibrionales bacterium]